MVDNVLALLQVPACVQTSPSTTARMPTYRRSPQPLRRCRACQARPVPPQLTSSCWTDRGRSPSPGHGTSLAYASRESTYWLGLVAACHAKTCSTAPGVALPPRWRSPFSLLASAAVVALSARPGRLVSTCWISTCKSGFFRATHVLLHDNGVGEAGDGPTILILHR